MAEQEANEAARAADDKEFGGDGSCPQVATDSPATTTDGKKPRKPRNQGGVEENPQRALEGIVIDDPDLRGQIAQYLRDKEQAAKIVLARNKSYDRIKERFPREDFAGKTIHVGPYTLTPKLTPGGGTRTTNIGERYRVTVAAKAE